MKTTCWVHFKRLSWICYKLSIVIVFLSCCGTVYGGTSKQAQNLQSTLLTDYNKDVLPVLDQSDALNVTVTFYLRSIQELNELTEEFFFTGAFALGWNDNSMVWDPASNGYIYHTYISYANVWVPEIIITTTSDDSDSMAKKWQRVRYTFNGNALIVVGGRFKATCGVDVEKYPFDKQVCRVMFQAWGYDSGDLGFVVSSSKALTNQFTPNSQWDLDDTELVVSVVDDWSTVDVYFYLSRKSSFTVISLVAPLLFMSILNLFVFILVPESGERVSYAITVLLAIAVFMTIISDALPSSSEPVPVITYKLMVDLIISASITLVTILNLGLYHRDESKPVPAFLKAFYICICCDRKEPNVVFVAGNDMNANTGVKSKIGSRLSEKVVTKQKTEVTWKKISFLIDYISLMFFSLASLIGFLVFIIKVTT